MAMRRLVTASTAIRSHTSRKPNYGSFQYFGLVILTSDYESTVWNLPRRIRFIRESLWTGWTRKKTSICVLARPYRKLDVASNSSTGGSSVFIEFGKPPRLSHAVSLITLCLFEICPRILKMEVLHDSLFTCFRC